MHNRLLILLVALACAYGWSQWQQRPRLQRALQNPSQFAQINEARASDKPLLFSMLLPGCPWAAHAAVQIPAMQAKFAGRYIFLQLTNGVVSTSGHEPFDYMAAKCSGGLCLFDPARGRVVQINEMISADALASAMERFARR